MKTIVCLEDMLVRKYGRLYKIAQAAAYIKVFRQEHGYAARSNREVVGWVVSSLFASKPINPVAYLSKDELAVVWNKI